MCILLSGLTFAILCVSQHICVDACTERVTKVEQWNTSVRVVLRRHRKESTIENMSAWHAQKTSSTSQEVQTQELRHVGCRIQGCHFWHRTGPAQTKQQQQKKNQFGARSGLNGNKTDEPICGSQLNVSRVVIFTGCDHGWQTLGQEAEKRGCCHGDEHPNRNCWQMVGEHLGNRACDSAELPCWAAPAIYLHVDKEGWQWCMNNLLLWCDAGMSECSKRSDYLMLLFLNVGKYLLGSAGLFQ